MSILMDSSWRAARWLPRAVSARRGGIAVAAVLATIGLVFAWQASLLDFGGFVVHVFGDQARRFYDLERLWRTAPKLEIADEPEIMGKTVVMKAPFGGTSPHGEAVSK